MLVVGNWEQDYFESHLLQSLERVQSRFVFADEADNFATFLARMKADAEKCQVVAFGRAAGNDHFIAGRAEHEAQFAERAISDLCNRAARFVSDAASVREVIGQQRQHRCECVWFERRGCVMIEVNQRAQVP